MRWLVILLLLMNVIYFGWEFDRDQKIQTRNRSQAINVSSDAQRLLLLAENEQPLIPVAHVNEVITNKETDSNGDPSSAEHTAGLVIDFPEISATSLDAVPEKISCFTFGPIPEELQAVGLGDWFKSRWATTNMRYTDEHGKQLFWIYLAPQGSRGDAMETILDLKQKGVNDYRLINRGNLENAISLGLFSSQATVNKRLQELERKGYKPVVVPYYNGTRVYWLDVELRIEKTILDTVFQGYPSRFNYVPVDCSKIAMG